VTEFEWSECARPERMLAALRGKTTDRKLRLFACGCCRRMWHLLSGLDRRAVELAERFADGRKPVAAVEHLARRIDWRKPGGAKYTVYPTAFGAAELVLWNAPGALAQAAASAAVRKALAEDGATQEEAFQAAQRAYYAVRAEAAQHEARAHAWLLRCVFGDPFRPATFAPQWRTLTVMALARVVYERRNFSALPILADALQDAGCDNEEMLAHCRDTSANHARGCWAVDLVLGNR
jgi:hypothetical protein